MQLFFGDAESRDNGYNLAYYSTIDIKILKTCYLFHVMQWVLRGR